MWSGGVKKVSFLTGIAFKPGKAINKIWIPSLAGLMKYKFFDVSYFCVELIAIVYMC
jgi:hypothetical protein